MKCIAIIPARGGSKRIPGKNIKKFLDKPVIAYSIQTAVESGLFDEIMVSTDDEMIAETARQYGASVPFLRSAKNADDHATTSAVIGEVLEMYTQRNVQFTHACCIYPTAPLLKADTLKNGYNLLCERSFTTVFPVVAFSFPIWRSLKVDNGSVSMLWPEYRDTRSQDLPKAWHDAGQFYWLDVPSFLKEPVLYGSNSGVIELGEMEVQDIDTLEDWQIAELKARLSV